MFEHSTESTITYDVFVHLALFKTALSVAQFPQMDSKEVTLANWGQWQPINYFRSFQNFMKKKFLSNIKFWK